MKDIIEIDDLEFMVELLPDEDHEAPWDNEDGHGPVSDWTTRDKKPGERVLNRDHIFKRYYDFSEAVKIALRDGWGIKDSEGKTKRQIASLAAEEDYQRMKDWCEDRWYYVGVKVTLLDLEGEPTHEYESLWGIESDCADYLDTVAKELAEEISNRMQGKDAICAPVRKLVSQ